MLNFAGEKLTRRCYLAELYTLRSVCISESSTFCCFSARGITLFCIFVPELIFFIFHDNYREKLFFSTAVGHTPSTAV
ncbi:MAG: hypothetical protein LBH84_06775, partial [Prevotellaceae bacterium]|nr:hypothetical protein [Prevotellaceae bacterium]